MRRTIGAALPLVVGLLFGSVAVADAGAADAASAPTEAAPAALEVAPYDQPLVQRALEAQAWVVMHAAHAHAVAHDGVYPAEVEDFADRLPSGDRMQNLWTGAELVPADTESRGAGSIVYRPIVWHGHRVGCEVTVFGPYGEPTTLVSDLGWWRRVQPDVARTAAR